MVRLSAEMLEDFCAVGVLFWKVRITRTLRGLREHTLELIEQFDERPRSGMCSAAMNVEHGDAELGDSYFEESATRFVTFRGRCIDEEGNLQQSKENSLNKIGHALHDLDPESDAFQERRSWLRPSPPRLRAAVTWQSMHF